MTSLALIRPPEGIKVKTRPTRGARAEYQHGHVIVFEPSAGVGRVLGVIGRTAGYLPPVTPGRVALNGPRDYGGCSFIIMDSLLTAPV